MRTSVRSTHLVRTLFSPATLTIHFEAMPFTLEPYKSPSTRHTCPSCGAIRQFAKYINTETSEYLADHVGRCNREQNCTYHYTPKQYFHDHPDQSSTSLQALRPISPFSNFQIPKFSNPLSFIPQSIFQSSHSNYKSNLFITFLKSIFDPTTVTQLINTYFIGTSKNWPGSTVFWQIDCQGNIRDGKIMLYDPTTGRRIKQPYNHITWAHSALKLKEYNLHQCFFGEHLLKLHPELPVSIVESEKTAIIASVYFPQFIWLATGGKHGCKWTSSQVLTVLKGRHITLWPDIKAYDDWKLKAGELSKSGLQVTISNLLEQVATTSEREAGLDIADFLIRFKPEQFTVFPNATLPIHSKDYIAKAQPEAISSLYHQFMLESHPSPFLGEGPGMRSWPLDELESFFSTTKLPDPPIRLNQCTVILNIPKFISGHLAILRTYNGNHKFLHYLHRLQLLVQILNSSVSTFE
ncbi:MAG: DUF6371 domain-containing protein [Bacteroidales bacterium]|nr:DUF6371 domain-containing protein [Bacteroidales bacterium]